jgi:formate hydrogenlyase subunit 3/multisubunit Na+/H+ antiporter MnhD subunit
MSAILPLFAGIVLICGRIVLPKEQTGLSLAKIASIGSFTFAGIAAIQMQWESGPGSALQAVSQVVISSEFHITLLHDRLSLCWLILNAGVASLILLSLSNRNSNDSNLGAKVIAIVLMLAVSQGIVLLSNGLIQWMLIALSSWLLLTICFLHDEEFSDGSRFNQLLITLTIADCFWMLGLIGIYFVSGTLQIPRLSEPDAFATLSDAATALMTTSVISLLISLVIRFGLFPMMTWSNGLTTDQLPLACLLAFPISIGGFLLMRWLPMISLFPEPRTLPPEDPPAR